MELNKEYKVSEYPIESLEPGTIIKVFIRENDPWNDDILVITDRDTYGNPSKNDLCVAVSIKDGETWKEGHHISTYEILRFKK